MARTTTFGLVMLGMSLVIGAAAAGALRHAGAMAAPIEPAARTIPGHVVELIVETCGPRNRTHMCFRPVVAYTDGGRSQQVPTRGSYSPAPAKKGDAADVLVFADGTAWVASEWQARQAERRRVHESARRTPTVLGWTLAGSAGFAAFLGLGLIFWVDRSGEAA